eukprot:COSAG06_NODE_24286_length_667_cov_0.901408_2_plen_87_part_01
MAVRFVLNDACDAHQPREGLGDGVHSGAHRCRPALAEAGDAAHNEARVLGVKRLPAKAETVHDARAVVLDDNVGGGEQRVELGLARL